MKAKPKKLVVTMSCGHSVVLEQSDVVGTLKGNHANCPKCPWNATVRRITERSWVVGGVQ